MSTTLFGLSYDTADAATVAIFWAEVFGTAVESGATGDNAIVPASGSYPRIGFHRVPEGKTVKNRLHLDLLTDDFASESARLTGLGARVVNEVTAGDARWTTFADVEGNEFDLIAG
jgi:predicted enzyme related to lactoylglutathione lyase